MKIALISSTKTALVALVLLLGCSSSGKDALHPAAVCYRLTATWSSPDIYRCRIEHGPVCYVARDNGVALWCER